MTNTNLLDNENFQKAFVNLKSATDLESLFAEHGLEKAKDCTWQELYDAYQRAMNDTSEELNEDDLENVAGGCVWIIAGCIVGVGAIIGGSLAIAGAVMYIKAKLRIR